MLNTIKFLFNNLTGQAHIKSIWGAIAGGLASGVAGSLLGGGGGGSNNNAPAEADDFSIDTGLFSSSFDNSGDNSLITSLSPEMYAIQNNALQQAGLFSGMQAPQFQQAQQLGSGYLDQLGTFDPMALAEQQYGLLSPIFEREQEQERKDLEAHLIAQGRLGSTGGSEQQGSLSQAQGDTRRRALYDAYNQGIAGQNHLANLGMGLSQFAPQLQGMYAGLGQTYLNTPLAIQEAALAPVGMMGTLSGAGGTGYNSPSFSQSLGQGLMTQGVNQISSGVNGMFTPSQDQYDYVPNTIPWTGPSWTGGY